MPDHQAPFFLLRFGGRLGVGFALQFVPRLDAGQRVSLAFSTYQTGKLFFLGRQDDGRLAVFERTFNRCMGLWADGQTLWLSSLYQLWRFENVLASGQHYQGHDRLYVPRVGYTTGDLDIHDVSVEAGGRVIFVNTKFGCLATLSDRDSFSPIWRPPFLSKLAPEDRCHLNGLAMEDGQARYMTAVSTIEIARPWMYWTHAQLREFMVNSSSSGHCRRRSNARLGYVVLSHEATVTERGRKMRGLKALSLPRHVALENRKLPPQTGYENRQSG